METPLGVVRGLGSAREGARNWWHERLSSIATLVLLVWWLVAAAAGADAYASFVTCVTSPWMLIICVPLTWGVIQHTLSGLRHFVMDVGAGYELGVSTGTAVATLVFSVLLTALLWVKLLGVI